MNVVFEFSMIVKCLLFILVWKIENNGIKWRYICIFCLYMFLGFKIYLNDNLKKLEIERGINFILLILFF